VNLLFEVGVDWDGKMSTGVTPLRSDHAFVDLIDGLKVQRACVGNNTPPMQSKVSHDAECLGQQPLEGLLVQAHFLQGE